MNQHSIEDEKLWWQTGIIYEIYIRSFQDSNDDGIGDIRGVIRRLDYLQWLGVKAVWLTPFFPSPMKDMGYDISDYTGIDQLFGSMKDLDRLLEELHRRNMKLIIDFVPNHTSDQHPWFQESRSSKDNPKRDWYYWKDARADGSPPNNWLSILGGPAWEWDETTGQYYYHAFLKEQPDLNLNHPGVMQAILDVMRFWLDKGVDGLRVDVMWHLVKDEKWRDNPLNPRFNAGEMPDCDRLLQIFSCDQPEVQNVVCRFRELMDTYHERVMLGELYLPLHQIVSYYGIEGKGAHLPGNFQLLFCNWNAEQISILINQYEAALPLKAWPNWVIGNHDRRRLIDRIGEAQSKTAAMLLLTLRGTPILYYGDEIGMRNVPVSKEECQDPQGRLMPDKDLCRDPQRSPMQWDDSTNAGFTKGRPWLKMDDNARWNNAEAQQKDPDSLLNFYKELIALRQSEPSLCMGDYYPVITDGNTLAYIRSRQGASSFLIVLNLTNESRTFQPAVKTLQGLIVLSSRRERKQKSFKEKLLLDPDECVIIQLEEWS